MVSSIWCGRLRRRPHLMCCIYIYICIYIYSFGEGIGAARRPIQRAAARQHCVGVCCNALQSRPYPSVKPLNFTCHGATQPSPYPSVNFEPQGSGRLVCFISQLRISTAWAGIFGVSPPSSSDGAFILFSLWQSAQPPHY